MGHSYLYHHSAHHINDHNEAADNHHHHHQAPNHYNAPAMANYHGLRLVG